MSNAGTAPWLKAPSKGGDGGLPRELTVKQDSQKDKPLTAEGEELKLRRWNCPICTLIEENEEYADRIEDAAMIHRTSGAFRARLRSHGLVFNEKIGSEDIEVHLIHTARSHAVGADDKTTALGWRDILRRCDRLSNRLEHQTEVAFEARDFAGQAKLASQELSLLRIRIALLRLQEQKSLIDMSRNSTLILDAKTTAQLVTKARAEGIESELPEAFRQAAAVSYRRPAVETPALETTAEEVDG